MNTQSAPNVGMRARCRIEFVEEGPYLVARCQMPTDKAPIRFQTRIDLRDVGRQVLRWLKQMEAQGMLTQTGSLFGGLGKLVRNIGRSNLVRQVQRTAQGIVRSPITNLATSAMALAFPPIGLPTKAAFLAANQVLGQARQGDPNARRKIRKAVELARSGEPKAQSILDVLKIVSSFRRNALRRGRPPMPPELARRRLAAERRAAQRQEALRQAAQRVYRAPNDAWGTLSPRPADDFSGYYRVSGLWESELPPELGDTVGCGACASVGSETLEWGELSSLS